MFEVESEWSKKYLKKLGWRAPTIQAALSLFFDREGKTIVETGTTRLENDWGAGMSTLVIADAIVGTDIKFWSVDISPENVKTCRQIVGELPVEVVCQDSLEFLKDFPDKIDLLYLDSWDYPIGGTDEQINQAQEHQLKEFKLAEPSLTLLSVVLLDDNDLPGGGKTKLTKEYLKQTNWLNLLDGQQSLWIRR